MRGLEIGDSTAMVTSAFARWRRGIEARYGTRRAWYRHHLCRLLHRTGWFRSLEGIDWTRVERLVFVCKGNICRSPYAEARARALGLKAISFGLEAEPGLPVNAMACRVARTRGLVLDAMHTRVIGQVGCARGDLLLAMEPAQTRWLARTAEVAAVGAQVTLLGLWKVPPQPLIGDPHGQSAALFVACFRAIDDAIDAVASRLGVGGVQESGR